MERFPSLDQSGTNRYLRPDPDPSKVSPLIKRMVMSKYGRGAVTYTITPVLFSPFQEQKYTMKYERNKQSAISGTTSPVAAISSDL